MLAGDFSTDSEAHFGHGDAVDEELMGSVVGSGSGALVMMMDAADVGDLDHTTAIRWVSLIQHNHVIETFAPDASDQSFNIRICQGLRSAVINCSTPMFLTRRWECLP